MKLLEALPIVAGIGVVALVGYILIHSLSYVISQ